jgi:hypothetical protein
MNVATLSVALGALLAQNGLGAVYTSDGLLVTLVSVDTLAENGVDEVTINVMPLGAQSLGSELNLGQVCAALAACPPGVPAVLWYETGEREPIERVSVNADGEVFLHAVGVDAPLFDVFCVNTSCTREPRLVNTISFDEPMAPGLVEAFALAWRPTDDGADTCKGCGVPGALEYA